MIGEEDMLRGKYRTGGDMAVNSVFGVVIFNAHPSAHFSGGLTGSHLLG